MRGTIYSNLADHALVVFDASDFFECVEAAREKETAARQGKRNTRRIFTREVVNTFEDYSESIVREIFDALDIPGPSRKRVKRAS